MGADVGENDFVPEIENQSFETVAEPARRFSLARSAIVRPESQQRRNDAQRRGDPKHDYVPGGRDVQRETADVDRIPARQLILTDESALEARIVERV